MWSFGCILYELITGETLFRAKNYLELLKNFIKVLGMPDKKILKSIPLSFRQTIQDLKEDMVGLKERLGDSASDSCIDLLN